MFHKDLESSYNYLAVWQSKETTITYWHQSLSVLIPFLSPNAVIGRVGKYTIMIG